MDNKILYYYECRWIKNVKKNNNNRNNIGMLNILFC